eukprot:gene12846-14075_t
MAGKRIAFTLHYFDVRARAEPIRMVLRYGGIPYEDHIVSYTEWMNGLKHNNNYAPFGQLPSITLPNGDVIAQAGAIIRIAAKLANLYPSDVFEAGRADMLFDKIVDMGSINAILNRFQLGTEQYQSNYEAFFEALPGHLKSLDALLGDLSFYGGEKPNYADFAVFHILFQCKTANKDALHGFPRLVQFTDRVASLPAIDEYLRTRPRTKEIGLVGSLIRTLDD